MKQATTLAYYHGATVLPTTYLHSYWARNHYRISKPIDALRAKREDLCITPENEDTTKYGEAGNRGYRERLLDEWLLKSGLLTVQLAYQWYYYGVPLARVQIASLKHGNQVPYHSKRMWPQEEEDNARKTVTVQAPAFPVTTQAKTTDNQNRDTTDDYTNQTDE